MNEWDRDNLMFLIKSSEKIIKEWYAQADDDDKIYAQELLAQYAKELKEDSKALQIEAKMYQTKPKFEDANQVLKKFTLNDRKKQND